MKLGKRTARLVKEAAVMGFVHGAMWGRVQGFSDDDSQFPHDSDVLRRVMRGARSHSDLYPLLSKAEIEGFEVYPAEDFAALRALLGVDPPAVSSQEEKKEGETDGQA